MEFKEFSGELIPAFEDKAISKILELEGGYREKDPVTGKQVKYGIDQVANPDINVKDLTEAEARRIYSDRYYRKSGADKLPEDLALVHFDAAVNQGGMAQKFLEESGGDLDKYIQLRKAHYINLAEQDPAKYGSSLKGWMNRLDKIEQEAKSMRQEFVPFEGDLDTGKGLVQKAKEYVGEQADLLTADAKIGLINAKMGVKQNQIAGLMELQEADFAKYGKDLEGMPAEEKSKHMATRKKLEEYLGDIAKYSTEARDVEKEYGVRASTKAMMRDLPESEEYKKASTFGKFKMVGEKFIEDPYGIITDLGLQSLPQSLAVAAPALAARFGMLSPKASAFVGGSTSAMNQFGSEYAKLREQGMDHIEAWEKAGVKSGVVGLFDAASFMSAGNAAEKIMSNISKGAPKAIKETAKVVGKETGRQAALGATGEVAGATVIGQEIEPTEVAAEAIGEVFGAPGEAVTTYRGKRAEAAAPRVAPQFTEVSPEDVIPATEVRKEPTFEEAPEIEVRGVGQVPTSEALDYEAMLAELEGIEAPKPAVAEEVVTEEVVEEPVAKVKKAVTEVAEPAVSEITPEDTREIKALEQQAKKISSAPTELGRFLQRQGIQPSEKSDLGLEKGKKGNRPAIFRGSAPSFDELTSRAISEGFLLPSGDDVQDVNNFREYVSEFLTSGNVSTGPDAARAAQLNDIQDQINSIKDKYVKKEEFGLEATTPEMLKAQEETRKAREAEAAAIEAQDAAERERQEIRRLGEKGAEDFALGRTAAEDLMGQRSVFEQAPEDIDAEMARKAEEGRAEIERRKAAGEEDFDIPFNIERVSKEPTFYPDEIERKPSLRVELNRLVKDNREGKVPPENFAMRAEQLLETTKKERPARKRERGENIIREKLIRAKRRGELSDEAVDLAEWFIKKNPALVDDIAISIRAPKDGEFASGMYNPLSRMIFLMKGSGNSETAVHEILHHTERMMPEDVQNGIRKAWSQSLFKADKAAQKGKDADLKKFFQHLMDYHFNGDKKAMKKATDMFNNGLVDYDQYQYINPSEFWAVNAADIVAKRYAVANSIVGKLKRWLAELAETIKNIFGFDNKAPLIKALNSLSKADGKFVSKDMLGHALNYANVHRNYKGEAAPLATWVEPNDSKLSDFLYKIQDRFVDVKDVQKAITDKVGQIEDQWDVYLKEELYHGRTATQAKEFLRDELMPVLNEMAKNNVNLQDFDDYLHNRHAQEYNEHVAKINLEMPDGGSGIFTEDAQAYLASLSPEKKKVYESLAKKIDNIVQGTQKILVKSGLEEQSAIDAWNKTFKYYVPLFRKDLDFSPTSGSGMGMGFGVRGATSKRAMGSFKDVADIFANIAAQREKAIVRAEKSRLGKALYGLAIKNPNPDFWLPVNPDAIKSKSALKRELVNMGLDETDAESIIQEPKTSYIDPRTGLVAYRVNPLLRSSDNVFPVRINGKDRYIFFNPSDPRANRMVRTLKNLDADQLGTLLNISAKITRWIASVNTQYNPVFGAYNFLRDVGGAQFNLSTTPIAGKQVQVTASVFPALRAIYRDVRRERAGKDPVDNEMSKLWQEFQKEGGITGFRDQFSKTNEEKNAIQKELEKLTESTTKTVAMAPFRAVFSWLSDYNESMENAVRLAAYKVALDQGLSKERAASLAKNLTVNFNRKGEKTKQANALFAFFNASVQGTKRLQETLSGPAGKKIVGGGLLLGVLQALMLAAAGFDEDEPPEFVKERNIIIPLGDGKYAAIPMPLGLHVIPSTGRMVTEFVMSGGKNPAKFTGDFLSMYLSAFNPIGNSGLSMQTISPTALDPIAAIFENRDNFGRPIAKEDRATNPTPGYTRTRDNASTIGKYLSEFLNYATGGTKYQKGLVSPTPDQIDYLIGQATGGVGREVQKVEQLITGDEETPPHKIPLVGKFYGDAASQSAQKNKFYANVVKMANHEQEIKGRIKNRETTSDYLEENPDARLWRMANRVENEITQLNKRKKELKEKGASPEVIKRIDEIKLRKMQQFNERVAEAEGR